MTRITFIRPNMYVGRSVDAMEPLRFAILKGLAPPDVETVLYDERLEPIPYDEPTDLVAMTVETYTDRRAYQIATEFRRRGVKVVMGGYPSTFLPEEALEFADAVVEGDDPCGPRRPRRRHAPAHAPHLTAVTLPTPTGKGEDLVLPSLVACELSAYSVINQRTGTSRCRVGRSGFRGCRRRRDPDSPPPRACVCRLPERHAW